MRELDIAALNEQYQFKWALDDFLVTDEQYPIFNLLGKTFTIDGYVIGICIKGKISGKIEGRRFEGTENFMLITRPLQPLQFLELSEDCLVRFIIFSRRFLVASSIHQPLIDKFQFSHPEALPVIQISEQDRENILFRFKNIWDRFHEIGHPFRKEIVGCLLLELLYDFESIYRKHFRLVSKESTRARELTQKFIELVKQEHQSGHNVEYYAKQLFVSPKHLSSAIKEYTGKTAGAYVAEIISLEAQSLLQEPNMSVKEVADKLNFPDQSTFGKFFKRTTGSTPTEYLKQYHGK